MSTGNNKEETIVTKKRQRVIRGYIHPYKQEIKKFDFFTGGMAFSGQYRMHNSREFIPILNPTAPEPDQVGCWQLISMTDPDQGTTSYQRVGMKYFLKYMKFKGHIGICVNIPFTIRYKLVLIKTDFTYPTLSEFMANNMCNYEPLNTLLPDPWFATERYCRHNFYKTYKWKEGMAEHRTSINVISSGTLSPSDYVHRPTKTSTLGAQNPSYSYTLPDILRFGSDSVALNQNAYLPINVSVTINDNVEVGVTHFYLLFMTDHGIGVFYPTYAQNAQLLYRATDVASGTVARFNFFGTCYFTDP